MRKYKIFLFPFCTGIILLISLILVPFSGCNKEDNTLAPYAGSPSLSTINLEKGSFKPKITWLGGYVSVLGVNHGSRAALDTSLIWLIHVDGNNLHYPVKFKSLPSNAQDITTQYGGTEIDSLNEDDTYTFWILKEEVWNQISSHRGKLLNIDSSSDAQQVKIVEDTLQLSYKSYDQITFNNDVYINIKNIVSYGKLADINIKTTMSNTPLISWKIKQQGVTDTLVAAIGIAVGNQFDPTNQVWEVYSITQDSSGKNRYGEVNIISSPVHAGDSLSGTFTFTQIPAEGLERNKDYYVWIADKNWDHETRARSTNNYAYATFKTW